MRSALVRYLAAALAFMASALWFGIGLQGGFICLFVFVLAFQTVRLYQRRKDLRRRRTSSRRRSRYERPHSEEPVAPSPARPRPLRSQPAGEIYDGHREEAGWPMASEATW